MAPPGTAPRSSSPGRLPRAPTPASSPAVIDHEWGHGLDDNDVNGFIPGASQGGGEGFADLVAALRHNRACIGRGFFTDGMLCSGYGDPCTPASGCDGVRTVDFADRTSGSPHPDLGAANSASRPGPVPRRGLLGDRLGSLEARPARPLRHGQQHRARGSDAACYHRRRQRLRLVRPASGPPPGGAGCGADPGLPAATWRPTTTTATSPTARRT